ncbi:MAG: tetratricopeptide repeat protein [Boseongicola sp.]|nr:tetratricopeptide repeat protein [Boseongicola sp.]
MGDVIAFDDFRIDHARGELTRGGVPVAVEPQVLDLIAHLAAHPGVVLTRDDLIDAVWGGRIVSDSAISSRINAARTALGDDGTAQKYIKTIPRRGFRFEADVGARLAPATSALQGKPSIAVLPFENLSGDPEQRYFSDGITDDIITELSRYGELFVISRHSSFACRDSDQSTAEIARYLGVQYIAEGSVRRVGDRIRVTAQLIDPEAGHQLWAERYDRDVTDIFEVQDEITTVIVNTMFGQIAHLHHRRVLGKDPGTVDAYVHVLKATEHALRVAPGDNEIAKSEVAAAIAIDPEFARAHAVRALTLVNEANNFWVAHQDASERLAHEAALAAIATDSRDPWAHSMLGIAVLWFKKDHAAALGAMRRGIELNPSNAYFHGLCSYVLAFCGEPREALAEIDTANRMNPLAPAVFLGFRGRALLLKRDLDAAIPILQQMVSEMPGHSNALGYCAAALVHAGRMDDAKAMVAELAAANPHYRLGALRTRLPIKNPEDVDYIVDALQAAGLPET